jgi:hypothetical protein
MKQQIMPHALLEHLKVLLENSYNAYTFRYRCRLQQIVIERMPHNKTVAYLADDRSGRETIDITRPPFARIKYLLNHQ